MFRFYIWVNKNKVISNKIIAFYKRLDSQLPSENRLKNHLKVVSYKKHSIKNHLTKKKYI